MVATSVFYHAVLFSRDAISKTGCTRAGSMAGTYGYKLAFILYQYVDLVYPRWHMASNRLSGIFPLESARSSPENRPGPYLSH